MSYTPYRDFDLFTHKCGVNPIIMGYLFQFKPWYYDGKRVYEGKYYELRSDAEKAAEDLKKFYINRARFLVAVREKPHLCLLQTALIDILLRGLVFFYVYQMQILLLLPVQSLTLNLIAGQRLK